MQTTFTLKILILILYSVSIHAQQRVIFKHNLAQVEYEELKRGFFTAKSDSTKATAYAGTWLKKAKSEQNDAQMASAYKALAYGKPKHIRYAFTDSMVAAAIRTDDDATIAAAYLTKGIAHYDYMEHQTALDHFITADTYIAPASDPYLIHKVKYQIAQTKYHLGYYHEAIALLLQCVNYFQDENDLAYGNSLYALGLCYTSIGDLKASQRINDIGIKAAKALSLPKLLPYFYMSEAINAHAAKKYAHAATLLHKVVPMLKNQNDQSNLSVAYFYLAKSYWLQDKRQLALPYLIKVDEIFNEQKYIRPDLIENYVMLVEYSKEKEDQKAIFFYMDRMMQAERLINRDFKYLSTKILGKYNTKKLREELQKIAAYANRQKLVGSGIIAILSASLITILYKYRKTRKIYSAKFEELMIQNKKIANQTLAPIPYSEAALGIGKELANTLLKRLENFERTHGYREPDMNLPKLAQKLNTNQKYVTKILAHYRNKGTIEYVSDLRIEYLVNKLETDKKFRNYKNEALSKEVGFGSTQIFTKTFKNKIGMPPTVFISELKKRDSNA